MTAWRAGDAAKLAALLSDEYKSFPTLYRVLVTERNKRWVPQIEKLLHGNQDYLLSLARCTWLATAACWSSCATTGSSRSNE